MKLITLFRTLSAGLFIMLILFSVNLIGNKWSIYQCHVNNTLILEGFKHALVAMEQISAERGYTNTFLGEDISVIAVKKNTLDHIRANTDDAINTLLPALARLPVTQRTIAVRHMHLLQQQTAINRKMADLLLSQDKASRPEARIASVIQNEIQKISYIDNTITILANNMTKNNVSLLDYIHPLQTITVLRDTAGQLGSILIPAVIKSQALTVKDVERYMQIRQRIGELHLVLNQQLNTATDLPQSLYRQQKNRLEDTYFRQALRFTDSIAATGKTSGNYTVTSAQLTELYVSSMTSIVQLRKTLSTYLTDVARHQKAHARRMLLLSISFCLLSLVFLSLALHTINKRMMMPIYEAALLLSQPVDTLYKRTPHSMYKTRDEASAMLLNLYAMRIGTPRKSDIDNT